VNFYVFWVVHPAGQVLKFRGASGVDVLPFLSPPASWLSSVFLSCLFLFFLFFNHQLFVFSLGSETITLFSREISLSGD